MIALLSVRIAQLLQAVMGRPSLYRDSGGQRGREEQLWWQLASLDCEEDERRRMASCWRQLKFLLFKSRAVLRIKFRESRA